MLKLVAALIMMLDHFSVVFLPGHPTLYWIGRLIGRIAMPIFAYGIAQGFIYTHNFKKYLLRIFVMTIFSQIPFYMLISSTHLSQLTTAFTNRVFYTSLNIGMTFICALVALWLFELSYQNLGLSKVLCYLGILVCLILSDYGDYGVYGVAIVALFYFYIKNNLSLRQVALWMTLLTFLGLGLLGGLAEITCVFSLLLIKYIPQGKIHLPKYFFYAFYPLHILILVVLKDILLFN